MEGSGKLELTGNLGDVMKESAQAALSCLRSRQTPWALRRTSTRPGTFTSTSRRRGTQGRSLRRYWPWQTAMLSALTDRKIKAGYAMTGEITLRGRCCPSAGLKERPWLLCAMGSIPC